MAIQSKRLEAETDAVVTATFQMARCKKLVVTNLDMSMVFLSVNEPVDRLGNDSSTICLGHYEQRTIYLPWASDNPEISFTSSPSGATIFVEAHS